jgi:aminopeptidase YwaD
MPLDGTTAREEVSSSSLTGTVEYLCSLGEKVSGSAEEEKACAFIVEQLRSYGYQPVVHTFESYLSYPRSTKLTIHAAGGSFELPAVGVAFGLSTPAGGARAPIVAVGMGDEKDFAGKDLRGKIALVGKLPSPNNALAAANAGALGMICMSAGKQRHKMIITPVWGTPEFDQAKKIPRVHVCSVSKVDGDRIANAIADGGAEATLECDVFEGWRTVRLPMAEIKGSEDHFSVVGAHYCSWFDGSTDNVTGDACVLELARVLKQFEGKLRYGLRFCWWPGHSHARYSGSTWFADTFWHEIYENGIVYFNIDSPGVRGATVYVPRHQMAEVSEYNERMTTEITGWSTLKTSNAQLALGKRGDKYVSSTRPSRAADQSFWGIGLSSMSVYSMLTPDDQDRDANVGGSGGAWWWHSEHETIDKFDPEILKQDTRLYVSILLGLSTADVLPFRLEDAAQDYLDSLREYDEAAGEVLPFAAVMAEAEALKAACAALTERVRGETDRERSAAVNKLMLRVCRTLNPILYQVCSPFEHDPALGSRALPSLGPALKLPAMDPASDAYRFTVTGLKRRLNQVTHQIREAARLVHEFETVRARA